MADKVSTRDIKGKGKIKQTKDSEKGSTTGGLAVKKESKSSHVVIRSSTIKSAGIQIKSQ